MPSPPPTPTKQTNGCLPGSGADTITLPAGSTQLLTVGPLQLFRADRTAGHQLRDRHRRQRQHHRARSSKRPQFRILAVDSAGDLILQETTVTGRRIAVRVRQPAAAAIFNRGTSTLTNSTVSGNSASFDLFGVGSGGGVSNYGTLTLSNSTVSGNSAADIGGGMRQFLLGTLTLTNSTVSGNSAAGSGGA